MTSPRYAVQHIRPRTPVLAHDRTSSADRITYSPSQHSSEPSPILRLSSSYVGRQDAVRPNYETRAECHEDKPNH